MSYRSNLQYRSRRDEFEQFDDQAAQASDAARAERATRPAKPQHPQQNLKRQAAPHPASQHSVQHPGQQPSARHPHQYPHPHQHAHAHQHQQEQHGHPQKHQPHRAPAQPQRHDQRHEQKHVRSKISDYALVHAGRQFRLGPVAFWIVIVAVTSMTVWTLLTGSYFAFRDDAIKGLISRQAEMQHAYEDRIAELRARLDRVSSRQLLDQEQFEEKLEQIARRQDTLEARTATLAAMPDLTSTGGGRPARKGDGKNAAAQKSSSLLPGRRDLRSAKGRGKVETVLAHMDEGLTRVERKQISVLSNLEDSYEKRNRRLRGVLADLGNAAGKAQLPPATGGPYIPVNAAAESFDRHVQRVGIARSHIEHLNRTLNAVPIRKPVDNMEFSSGFGVRLDPFLRKPALHAGLDMRGNPGDPVRATATGTVTFSGINGGYGKMVEIDHGNGLTTRYAHLLSADAKVGQSVQIGQIVGRLGSTGRSTGPHLHYETRVGEKPIDPRTYLHAGTKL